MRDDAIILITDAMRKIENALLIIGERHGVEPKIWILLPQLELVALCSEQLIVAAPAPFTAAARQVDPQVEICVDRRVVAEILQQAVAGDIYCRYLWLDMTAQFQGMCLLKVQ